jgi:hypothetical protein
MRVRKWMVMGLELIVHSFIVFVVKQDRRRVTNIKK